MTVQTDNTPESMMYNKHETPWHGIGTAVQGRVHAAEAIKAAGLDWKVEPRAIYAAGADGQKANLIEGSKAIVRVTDNRPLGIVTDRYKPFQNVEAFDFLDEVVGQHAAMYETAGSLNGGKRIFLLAKLPETLKVTRNDVVDKFLLLTNTHDGSGAIRAFYTPVRVVCQNTLNHAMAGFSSLDGISIRHTTNAATKLEAAKKVLGLADTYYNKLGQVFKELVKIKYTGKMALDLVNNLFPSVEGEEVSTRTKNNRESVLELFEGGLGNADSLVSGSAWAIFNGVTEFADHFRSTRVGEGGNEQESRLNANWFGTGRALKQKAWDYIADQVDLKIQKVAI